MEALSALTMCLPQEAYVTRQDGVRLVGELVTVIGAVIILILEVWCAEGLGWGCRPHGPSLSPSYNCLCLSRSQTSSGSGSLASSDTPSLEGRSMCSCESPSSRPHPVPHWGSSLAPWLPGP